jgi:hypothetical protein
MKPPMVAVAAVEGNRRISLPLSRAVFSRCSITTPGWAIIWSGPTLTMRSRCLVCSTAPPNRGIAWP